MNPVVVAGRYARALAEVVGTKNLAALDAVTAEVRALADAVASDPDLAAYFDSPTVAAEDKQAALAGVAKKAALEEVTRRFLLLLVAKRRFSALPAIARALAQIRDEAMGIVPAETTVAAPLSAPETAALTRALESMTGRKVRLSVTVDPAILGGARTRIGSRVYDGTLRGRLDGLHRALAGAR